MPRKKKTETVPVAEVKAEVVTEAVKETAAEAPAEKPAKKPAAKKATAKETATKAKTPSKAAEKKTTAKTTRATVPVFSYGGLKIRADCGIIGNIINVRECSHKSEFRGVIHETKQSDYAYRYICIFDE